MTVEEILAAMQAIIDAAREDDGTERPLTDEEASRYEALEAELRSAQKTAELRSRQKAYSTVVPGPREDANTNEKAKAYARAYDRFLRTGVGNHLEDSQEFRALSKGTDSAGGYLVPDEWRDKLVQCMKSFGGFAEAAEEVNSSDGRKWLWPTVSDETTGTPNEGVITAEAAAFAGGADPVFGEASLDVFKYTTSGASDLPIRVSVELLQDSGADVDSLLRRLMAIRIQRKQARDFVVGTGSGMPKGILNGTADAELAVTNTWNGTNNGYPLLLSIVTLLDQHYLDNASWLMNRATYAQILGLVDGNGRPLIMPSSDGAIGNGVGRGMTILGYPVVIDSAAPNAADDTNFMAFGDFRQAYVVRRVQELEVIADPYARKMNGQVEYVAWQRAGGTVQDRCAYVIIKGKDA
jgi:HK97 family phage major capsid protein